MNTVLMDTTVNNPNLVTPALVLDFEQINQTYNRFIDAFPGGQIYYAVKANANPDVMRLVVEKGGGLEIASLAELERSLSVGATGRQIICSNPIKNPTFMVVTVLGISESVSSAVLLPIHFPSLCSSSHPPCES